MESPVKAWGPELPETHDVIVVGSGAGGLMAAAVAADAGLQRGRAGEVGPLRRNVRGLGRHRLGAGQPVHERGRARRRPGARAALPGAGDRGEDPARAARAAGRDRPGDAGVRPGCGLELDVAAALPRLPAGVRRGDAGGAAPSSRACSTATSSAPCGTRSASTPTSCRTRWASSSSGGRGRTSPGTSSATGPSAGSSDAAPPWSARCSPTASPAACASSARPG